MVLVRKTILVFDMLLLCAISMFLMLAVLAKSLLLWSNMTLFVVGLFCSFLSDSQMFENVSGWKDTLIVMIRVCNLVCT